MPIGEIIAGIRLETTITGSPSRVRTKVERLNRLIAQLGLEGECEFIGIDFVEEVSNEDLARLNRRLRSILELHYGLKGEMPLTYAAIARKMNVTTERIRQLEA